MDLSLFGLKPDAELAPKTVDELASALRHASAEGAAVVPWGAGTHQHIGAPPQRYSLALRTTGLDQVVEYTPADLVVTVQAGVRLGDLQRRLAEHGQRLPWDPPASPEATIGGLLAVNASGPLRLGHGPPRDWVLGMQVVLGDGRPVRSGGKVVKNVAGYDAHKLHIGALGTLGVITEVTFKLAPLSPAHLTIVANPESMEEALRQVELLRQAPLEPASLILTSRFLGPSPETVAARFEGTQAALQRLAVIARERLDDMCYLLEGGEEQHFWDEFLSFCAQRSDVNHKILLRAGARPGLFPQFAAALRLSIPELALYGGVGLGYGWRDTWGYEPEQVQAWLEQTRARLAPLGGYAVVEDAPAALRAGLDIWGPAPPTLPLMRALKAQWDPRGALNPGRYIGAL